MVFPIVLGKGKRLFADAPGTPILKLVDVKPLESGHGDPDLPPGVTARAAQRPAPRPVRLVAAWRRPRSTCRATRSTPTARSRRARSCGPRPPPESSCSRSATTTPPPASPEAARRPPTRGSAWCRRPRSPSIFDGSQDLHILGYLIDPDDPTLRETLERSRSDREHRAQAMADALRELGFELDEDALAPRGGRGQVDRTPAPGPGGGQRRGQPRPARGRGAARPDGIPGRLSDRGQAGLQGPRRRRPSRRRSS